MRRHIVIALLALGTIGGYAAGFASLHHHHPHRGWHSCDDRGADGPSEAR